MLVGLNKRIRKKYIDQWSQLKAGVSERNNHSAAAYNGKLYIFGGYSSTAPGGRKNDLWEYNIGSDTWRQLGVGASIRNTHTLTSHGDKLYLHGGWNGEEHFSDMWAYNISLNTWLKKTSSPIGLMSALSFTHGIYIYYVSGSASNGKHGINFIRYNTVSDTWDTLPDTPVLPAESACGAYKNRVYFYRVRSQNFLYYDLIDGTWNTLPDTPFILDYSRGGIIDDDFYIFGRTLGSVVENVLYRYEIDESIWVKVSTPPIPAIVHPALAVHDGLLYIHGGWYDPARSDKLWKYIP